MEKRKPLDFQYIERTAYAQRLAIIGRWLPDGKFLSGDEFTALNPRRADRKAGSFKINMSTLKWSDFATGDCGKGIISLASYLFGIEYYEAAQQVARMIGVEELAYV